MCVKWSDTCKKASSTDRAINILLTKLNKSCNNFMHYAVMIFAILVITVNVLFQEAEHRRITEQQQRTAALPRKPSPPHSYPHTAASWSAPQPQPRQEKPLPDAIIQTLTQRVQKNRVGMLDSKSSASSRRRYT